MTGSSTHSGADFFSQSNAPLDVGISSANSFLPPDPLRNPLDSSFNNRSSFNPASAIDTAIESWLPDARLDSMPAFTGGYFTVGSTGQVSIDYLFDGGSYEGELGIFSLTGLEQFDPGSDEFIQEAVRRVLSNSLLGNVVIRDATDAAHFTDFSGWDGNFNAGDYSGVKTVAMNPGDTFGVVMMPNGTFEQILGNTDLWGNQRPLFSMVTANPNQAFQFGQIADVTGKGSTFSFEDLRMDSWSDRDYNDVIFQVRGAIGSAVSLDKVIDPGNDWRKSDLGKKILDTLYPIDLPILPIDPSNGAEYFPGDLLVRFSPTTSQAEIQAIAQQFGAIGVESLDNSGDLPEWRILRFTPETNLLQIRSALTQNSSVSAIDLNYKLDVNFSRDPLSSQLWGLNNTGQNGGRVDADIDLPEAWRLQTGNSNITVAVIDTGIDYRHPDLAPNIWRNPREILGNGIDDDRNGFIDDAFGYDFINNDNDPMDNFDRPHGTHVAGTIGSVGSNNIGMVGVSPNVKLMPLKFMNSNGGSTLDAARAVNYATSMGAKVINASFGGGGYSQAMFDAIQRANSAGVTFVASAGNSGLNTDVNPQFPAAYNLPNVISVTATDRWDQRAIFSNFGRNSVDIGAPGVDIVSTLPNNSYGSANGTSMAAPHVAGVAALLYAQNQNRSATEVRSLILQSGDRIDALRDITATGTRLNANKAVIRGMIGLGSRAPELFRSTFDNALGSNYNYAPISNAYRWGNGWTQELRDSRGNRVLIMLEDGATTAYAVFGSNLDEYLFLDGPVGRTLDGRFVNLGYPRSNENAFTNPRDGRRAVWQQFAADNGKSRIHNLSGFASVATWGTIGSLYTDMSGASSWLGMPTRREYFDGDTVFTDFQGGRIAYGWNNGRVEALRPGELPSWRRPVGNPDIDIQLDFYGVFSQAQRGIIEQAARNWENVITRDKVPSGVLRIAITQGANTMNGGNWGFAWGEATWTDYANQRSVRYDLTTNYAGEARVHYNSNRINDLTRSQLVQLTMHELGHALGLDEAQYDSSLGLDGIMDMYGLDPRLTEGVFQRLEWMGYGVNRGAQVAWS
jgi:subtilisin family serine protease